MITFTRITDQDISDDWLKNALTDGLKECVTAPLLSLDPTEPEPIRRAKMIIDNFSREDCPALATLVAPGQLIQVILPKDELLISVIFKYINGSMNIQVSVQKLLYHDTISRQTQD